jgi:hypothetical protein
MMTAGLPHLKSGFLQKLAQLAKTPSIVLVWIA